MIYVKGRGSVSKEELKRTCVDYFGEYISEEWLNAFVEVRSNYHTSLWEFMNECRRVIKVEDIDVPFHSRYKIKKEEN